VVADVSTGAIQLRLDALSIAATTGDAHWESAGPSSRHHYLLRVNSGAVRVSLEEDATITAPAVDARTSPAAAGGVMAALNLVLDGIAARRE
jgi:predicted PhzF superfamily epimerase YddE/YHI9